MSNSGERANERGGGQVQISGSLLARNTLINLLAQITPLMVAVFTIPLVVRGLGTERFGLLAIAWVILGYFTLFDLGLGRATTKYVAEAFGNKGEDQVPGIIWTAVTVQALTGLMGAFILWNMTDLLVYKVLNIPAELLEEARITFHLLALSIPVILISSSFSGALEAAQRFDLLSAVRIPSSMLTYLLPLLGISMGLGLPGIVVLILLARSGALIAFLAMNLRMYPGLREYSPSLALFSSLFAYGGWITVTSIVGPVLVYLDRLLIVSLLTVSALAYYAAPYEAVTRLWVIPASLSMTVFPAFSTLMGQRDEKKLAALLSRSVKYVLLSAGPVAVVIWLFAGEILQIWLGADFARESTAAMQILALGVLINSLAQTPFAFLQGVGRPDLPAKFHLIQLPLYIAAAWMLVSGFGITGAAGAWTLRVALDALLLFWATFRVYGLSLRLLEADRTMHAATALAVLAGAGYGLKTVASALSIYHQTMLVVGLMVVFACFSWARILDGQDRKAIMDLARRKSSMEG